MRVWKQRLSLSKLAVAAIACAALSAPAAHAEKARTAQIRISYVPPKNPAHQPIVDRLKNARSLEKLQEFLSPFRLPQTLLIKTEGCDGEANAWYDEGAITICYEYIAEMWKAAPTETTKEGVAPIDALVAPIFDTALHEFAHAIFDILKLPVFGREEDAADQVASYIALHLGKDAARRQIGGIAYAYMAEASAATAPPKLQDFANEHGTPAQRYYNVLCIAYGADPEYFGQFVQRGDLPKDRAEGCGDEYRQAKRAFDMLIAPHLDQKLVKSVLSKSWLPDRGNPVPGKPRTTKPPR
jgi:Putative metallopeptidase